MTFSLRPPPLTEVDLLRHGEVIGDPLAEFQPVLVETRIFQIRIVLCQRGLGSLHPSPELPLSSGQMLIQRISASLQG